MLNQNGILAAVKSFCRFLKVEGYLATDPAEAIEYARQPHSLPRNVLTPQEAKRIIEAVDTTTVLGYRDRTILEVLYATGIRNEELRNLTVADVNLEEGLLRDQPRQRRQGPRDAHWPDRQPVPGNLHQGHPAPTTGRAPRATGFSFPSGATPSTPIPWATWSSATPGWPGSRST